VRVVLTGATGFLGFPLVVRLLADGHEVTILSRRPALPPHFPPSVTCVQWDPSVPRAWEHALDGADAVVNLAGASIAGGRWSWRRKRLIVESRLAATRALVDALGRAAARPRVLLNASAVGYYGNVADGDVTEDHPCGVGFLPETCSRWEAEARRAETLGVRVAILRIGIVLDAGGGMLQRLLLPFRLFAGGPLGSGGQWLPWIHLDDVVGAMAFALTTESLAGPVNLTAPQPHTMRAFCAALGTALGRPSWLPVPAIALRIILGEMSTVVLHGQRALPRRLSDAGYPFLHPHLQPALHSILARE
jgi:uncharacterized protein (TIGR01777 family)